MMNSERVKMLPLAFGSRLQFCHSGPDPESMLQSNGGCGSIRLHRHL